MRQTFPVMRSRPHETGTVILLCLPFLGIRSCMQRTFHVMGSGSVCFFLAFSFLRAGGDEVVQVAVANEAPLESTR